MKKTAVFLASIVFVLTLSTQVFAAQRTVSKIQPDAIQQFQVDVKDTSTQKVATKTFDTSATHITGQTVYTQPGFEGRGSVGIAKTPGDTILYSLGVAMPQTVFGGDDRVESNTLAYPFRAVCRVVPIWDTNHDGIPDPLFDYYGGGSGFMVSPDECVTAGHVIYNSTRGWATWVDVYPAMDGTYTPYGPTGTKLEVVPSEYINNTSLANVDWGVLKLTSSIGIFSGYLSCQYRTERWNGTNVAVAGYPDDKQTDISGINRTQWHNSQFSPVTDPNNPPNDILYYQCDTATGESGGPIYTSDNIVIGVNSYVGNPYNFGCRMTDYLYNMIINMQK